jgi:hypothetical protein
MVAPPPASRKAALAKAWTVPVSDTKSLPILASGCAASWLLSASVATPLNRPEVVLSSCTTRSPVVPGATAIVPLPANGPPEIEASETSSVSALTPLAVLAISIVANVGAAPSCSEPRLRLLVSRSGAAGA